MALADPLPAEVFADLLHVQDWQFVQSWQQQRSATGGGESRYADRAPSIWAVDAVTIPVLPSVAEGLMARINSRAGGLKTVLLYNKRLPRPATDPKGEILAGDKSPYLQTFLPWSDDLPWNDAMPWGGSGVFQPKLGAITDRLLVAFTGFPPGYTIPFGTYFGIVFDTSRYYLGQFVEDAEADGSGNVATVEVYPPLPASILGAPDVELNKPCAKFRITPGSAFPAKVGSRLHQIQFSAEQTYSP